MDYAAQQAVANAQQGRDPNRRRTADGHVEIKRGDRWRKFIDVNQGPIQRVGANGLVVVCMYPHRPGEYWTIKGEPVPEAVAAKAGFDIEAHRAEKAIRDDQQAAAAKLQAIDKREAAPQVVEQAGPYTMTDCGNGHFMLHRDGTELLARPAPEALVRELFADFAASLAPAPPRASRESRHDQG